MSSEPGEPGRILDHEGERRLVTPRSLEPETGHSEHDEIRSFRPEGLIVKTQLIEHARGVVLDDDVAGTDEPAQDVDAAGSRKSIVMLFLLVLSAAKIGRRSQNWSSVCGTPPTRRAPSGRLGDSRWITSAPRSARTWPASGPAQ